jgi:hypothetical protein
MAVKKTVGDLLKYEIAHGTQRSVAVLYAMHLIPMLEDNGFWAPINEAIKTRWSIKGLERVKKMAWEINDAMCVEEAA